MKRFLISLITICCLISSISASSLLFTPHHVSIDPQVKSNSLLEKREASSVSIHIDADGKRELTNHNELSFHKYKKAVSFIFNNNTCLLTGLNPLHEGTLFPFHNNEEFLTEHCRTVLFPFHSFW